MNQKFEAVPVEEWLKEPRARRAYNCLRKSGEVILSYYYPNDEKQWQFEYTNITHVLLPVGDEWVSVEDRLPEIDKEVLVYYTIESKKDKKTFEYQLVGILQSITTYGENKKSTDWRDKDWNSISPTHWRALPQPPSQTNKPKNE